MLGDFAPYIYRTDDYGKTWKRLTDGKNGIAADEPTRVVREDPDRAGLLYAGTEFGIYVSFDNGDHWQSFQMNLPVTPVTDMKIAHKDLVISTQGRSFWILDDLTPLHQLSEAGTTSAILFKPREAVRTVRGGGGGGLNPSALRYPQPGAMIDYYLPSAPSGEVSMEIVDGSGKTIRTLTSAGSAADDPPADAPPADDEEGGGRGRGGPTRLEKSAGMHRFTWDLRYGGPWASANRPEGANGPEAVPGKYSVRVTAGSWTSTQPLTLIEDPRIIKAGLTDAALREQFEHNMRVRELVSDVNKTVARLRTEMRSATGAKRDALETLAGHLITPSIRYSKPELQTHITYLYSITNCDGSEDWSGCDGAV